MMKIKDICGYKKEILSYCEKKTRYENMLIALDEDLSIDKYQDSQPGGGNCVFKNRKEYQKYEALLEQLDVESVFGNLYRESILKDRKLLQKLLNLCEDKYGDQYPMEINLLYQMLNFLDCLSSLEISEKELKEKDFDMIVHGGQYFKEYTERSYDQETEKFLLTPDERIAKKYLSKIGLLSEIPSVDDMAMNILDSVSFLNVRRRNEEYLAKN